MASNEGNVLPPEIIAKIIRMSVPPPSYGDAQERTSTLRTLACVNTVCHYFAEEGLFDCPVIRSDRGGKLFLAAIRRRPSLASRITALRLDGNRVALAGRMTPYATQRLLDGCPYIKHLWLWGCREFDLSWLSRLPSLEELVMHDVKSVKQQADFEPLLHLRSLSLFHVVCTDPSQLLSPITLPSLRHLAVDRILTYLPNMASSVARTNPDPLLLPFDNQLECVSRDCPPPEWPGPVTGGPHSHCLWDVPEFDPTQYTPLEKGVQTQIRHLRWISTVADPFAVGYINLVVALVSHRHELHHLQTLYLPLSYKPNKETQRKAQIVLGLCEERGVQVVFEEQVGKLDEDEAESMISREFLRACREGLAA